MRALGVEPRHHRQPGRSRRTSPTSSFPASGRVRRLHGAAWKSATSPGRPQDWIAAGRPYFGICLGYQILFDDSEETPGVAGLGVVPGTVRRFTENPASRSRTWAGTPRPGHRGETRVWARPRSEPVFLLRPLLLSRPSRSCRHRRGNHLRHPDLRRRRRARQPPRLPVPPGKKPGSRPAADPEFPRPLKCGFC